MIYANGLDGDIIRSCLKNDVEFLGFLDDSMVEKNSFHDIVKDSDCFFITRDDRYANILYNYCGLNENNVVIFYDRAIRKNFRKNLKFLSRYKWIPEYLQRAIYSSLFRLFPCLHPYLSKYESKRNIKFDVKFLKKYHTEKIVFIGVNELTKIYLKKLEKESPKNIWGVISYPNENLEVDSYFKKYLRKFDDIFYEDLDNLFFYSIIDEFNVKISGTLLENGVSFSHISRTGNPKVALFSGAKAADSLDPLLGYSRIDSEFQSFSVFSNISSKNNKDVFKIITLGGSTSDPTYSNVKSWSEYLFEMLNTISNVKPVVIYAGGVIAYTAQQELLKLIKDCMPLNPDLILSYSGINNTPIRGGSEFFLEKNFFIMPHMLHMFEYLLSRKKIMNVFQGTPVKNISLGIENNKTRAQFWIDCERMMYAICKEFGIKFHAFFQPFSKQYLLKMYNQDMADSVLAYYKDFNTYIAGKWGGQNGCMILEIYLRVMITFFTMIAMFSNKVIE